MKNWAEYIPDYINERLSNDDREAFDLELRTDVELQNKLKKARIMDQAMDVLAEEQLGEEMDQVRNSVLRGRTMRILLGSAASVLIVIAGYFGIKQVQSQNFTELFAEYYHAPLDPTQRNGIREYTNPMEEGIALFHSGEFEKSMMLLRSLIGTDSEEEANYYIGHNLLAQDSLVMAGTVFDKLRQQDGPYHDKAEWFAMLAYLKNGNTEKFELILEEIISNPEHDYHQKAISLSEAM